MKYKIIVDKQSRINPSQDKREYEIDIEELRAKGNVYDSLVITKDEDYVMRRLSLSEYHVLTVLPESVKEPLLDVNIELFEGDNYIYLVDMTGNKFYAEYLVKNDFTDMYVTINQMNSAINQTANQIELTVNQKLEGYSTTQEMNSAIDLKAGEISQEVEKKVNEETITGAYLILKINGDTSEAKLNADKIKLSANDVLNLLAGNTINLSSQNITVSSELLTIDEEGHIALQDSETIGGVPLKITKDGTGYSTETFATGYACKGPNGYVRIEADFAMSGGSIFLAPSQNEGTNRTLIQNGYISCVKLTQTSLKSRKKNIKKLKINALDLVKEADICEYNFKKEKAGTKKHIGLVIGEGYNCPEQVISEDGQGVEQYSLTSLLWKAVQELTEKVERMEGKLNEKNTI